MSIALAIAEWPIWHLERKLMEARKELVGAETRRRNLVAKIAAIEQELEERSKA